MGSTPEARGAELRSRACAAIERMQGSTDKRREVATEMIERFDTADGEISRLVLATSSPEYLRAFCKIARAWGQTSGLTQEEAGAVTRAMSLTTTAGGFLVPFQLDPTVIITSAGSTNEVRKAARTVVATDNIWHGVSAGETSWSWDGEGVESSDDASTFAQPVVQIFKGVGFVPISEEALMDEQNVTTEVGRLLASGKETLEAVALATGNGTTAPRGLVTALVADTTPITSTTTDVFAIGDVYKLQNALPARFRGMASFAGNNAIYNLIRQFDTAGGAGLWERIGNDRPPQLIPQLFDTANNLPSGKSGWRATFRMGSNLVNAAAGRILNIT
jgi:HK97 family phage major capsid protein